MTDLVPGEFTLAIPAIIFRICVDDVLRELSQFPDRDALVGIGQAGRICEIRFGQAQFARAAVHHAHEIVFVAGNAFRQRDAAIIR